MLKNLSITNVALIDKIDIEFNDGLCVITGETGAGKSILVDSLAFVLGERADKSLIKSDCDYAFVEAAFDIGQNNSHVAKILSENGFEVDDTVILSRKMTAVGKNECRICGRVCTLTTLKAVSAALVDIFGQTDHINILNPQSQLQILDDFKPCVQSDILKKLTLEYKNLQNRLKDFGGSDAERSRTLDLLEYEIKEIESAEITNDEEEQLRSFVTKVANTQKIVSGLKGALVHLTESGNVGTEIWLANNSLTPITPYDGDLEEICNKLASFKYEIDDIVATLEQKTAECDFNPAEVDRAEERLDLYKRLKRKYGSTVNDVLTYLDNSIKKCNDLIDAAAKIEEINADIDLIKQKCYAVAKNLSQNRKDASKEFCDLIINELMELGIKNATFAVSFNDAPTLKDYTPDANGYDKPVFMFSANAGEPLKELSKVISGGEMSRFLLALKNITAGIENIPTMVFDEIDVGLSGNVAQMVAKKLANISRNYQCLVITHLPQVAAMGDSNYLIQKQTEHQKTKTSVEIADTATKIKEIERLMGGDNIGEYSRLHAQEMLEWADNYKKNI